MHRRQALPNLHAWRLGVLALNPSAGHVPAIHRDCRASQDPDFSLISVFWINKVSEFSAFVIPKS